ncbi:hypothetical protein A3SI_19892 [Nitritalea halalkaliphila LW7]|uniref:Uncharacterized protein n=1 Tax=Nitritalea halalkaliphila LW7 TaxID=1189621 RepID=I5BRT0_9BACT|nr:hypothetical protein [Nitritalea halalkaliphila]EIM72282.1 hypothetical protein A3SI_19892 [Nitritalea halalkaliphila LW7]
MFADFGIDLGRLKMAVAQKVPDLLDAQTAFQKVCGDAVPQAVKPDPVRKTRLFRKVPEPSPKAVPGHPVAVVVEHKSFQAVGGGSASVGFPFPQVITFQVLGNLYAHRHSPSFSALAGTHVQQLPLEVDVGYIQFFSLRPSQPQP